MKLLNTYEDQETGELALSKITGQKRLASERDSNEVIYNLFGEPSWGNFYKLGMFNLPLLKEIVDQRKAGLPYDTDKHNEIIRMLKYAGNSFELTIPEHWL